MPVRCALARFEIEQELAAVRLDRAQLVELGVVAVRDHAAFAQHRARAPSRMARVEQLRTDVVAAAGRPPARASSGLVQRCERCG